MTDKNEPCQTIGCTRKAVTHSIFCLRHHIESLQTIRSVPSLSGRWFPPRRVNTRKRSKIPRSLHSCPMCSGTLP
jgi:hypothetical protein